MNDRYKFLIGGKHFAYITSSLWVAFRMCKIVNFTVWVRENIYKDFGVYLDDDEDWDTLEQKLKENFYMDKSDWLREKMRLEIKAHRSKNKKEMII